MLTTKITLSRGCETSIVRATPQVKWEKAKWHLSPHPHPLTDSHQILHTWLRRQRLLISHIWSISRRGLLPAI